MAPAQAFAQESSPEQKFAEQVLPRLKEAAPSATYELGPNDPLQIKVTDHPKWEDATFNLHRIFGICSVSAAEECEAEIDRYVDAISETAPEFTPADLRIIVRDAEYWSFVERQLGRDGVLPAHRKIGDDLFAILALDTPNTIQVAAPKVIAELGLVPEVAWAKAHAQTKRVLAELPSAEALQESLMAFEGDAYVGTMLADLEAWKRISAQVGPDLMATAASDDFVVIGLIPDGESLEGFKEAVAEDCASAPRCLSPHVYRFRDGQWVIAD
ncbi:MAG: hypothetical protein AAGK01_00630 [Pseudomonadota bacterium]